MPAGVGMKNADPTIAHVLAALTGTGRRNLDYMRMILFWARAHRTANATFLKQLAQVALY